MYLHLGSIPTVVVSSPVMAKEFLKTHDAIFASRPTTFLAGKYLSYDFKDVALAPYGPYWRHMKKLCTLELLSPKRIDSFRSVREEEGVGRRVKKVMKIFDAFTEKVIDEHVERMKLNEEKEGRKDFVDVLLEMQSTDIDMLLAGVETSSMTMEWCMAELLRNPHVTKKAQEEIESVVGKDRIVMESDVPNLEYIQCLRGGYNLPRKTRLIVNVWAIATDPAVWEDPLAFKPERFMGRDVNVKGQTFELLPFGSGRRSCPGASLALVVVESALTQLLHCFEWGVEDIDPRQLDMTESFGMGVGRRNHLYALPKARLPIPNGI
eukprot:Gb_05138 [translate_table: standard]